MGLVIPLFQDSIRAIVQLRKSILPLQCRPISLASVRFIPPARREGEKICRKRKSNSGALNGQFGLIGFVAGRKPFFNEAQSSVDQ